jgi:hypothetical protein
MFNEEAHRKYLENVYNSKVEYTGKVLIDAGFVWDIEVLKGNQDAFNKLNLILSENLGYKKDTAFDYFFISNFYTLRIKIRIIDECYYAIILGE